MEREEEVRERTQEIEAATVPQTETQADVEIPPEAPLDHYDDYHLKAINTLKKQFNDSLELFSDKLLQLENEVAELKQRASYDGTLSENDIVKVVGVILGNDKLAEFLGQKLRDKFKDKVKVNYEIS
jgi:hypothetical protein